MKYESDLVGRIQSLLRPDDEAVTFDYDDDDNLLSLTPPGRGAHTFAYQPKTSLLELSTPPAVSGSGKNDLPVGGARYDYNDDRQLLQIARSDGQNLDFHYDDASGRLKSLEIPDATISYGYDSGGMLTSVNRSDSVKVTLSHDGPLWTGSTWSGAIDGSVTAKYDENFFLASMTVNGSSTAKFTYDDDGLVTSATANNVTYQIERDAKSGFITNTTLGTVTTATDYNGFGEPSRLRAAFQGNVNFTEKLERDALGRITHIDEIIGNGERGIDYDYDELGRLVKETVNGTTTEYDYDANGNRTSVSVDGALVADADYDAQDRLTRFGSTDVEATPQGDLLRMSDGDDANELVYDALGNLLSVTQNRSGTTRVISYKVDGLGRRVARQVDGKFDAAWVYRDGLRPVGQVNSAGIFMHFIYADDAIGGAPDYILRAGVPYRVIKDHVGSVRLVVNAQTGVVEQKLDYDAFGHVTGDTNPGFQPFGFAGGLDDAYTGYTRFGARDYSGALGRWLSKDPIGFGAGDTNVYAYCGNDPINHVDADGKRPLTANERAFLKRYYGGSLDYDSIDVEAMPAALRKFAVGMNPYGRKIWLKPSYFVKSNAANEVNFKSLNAAGTLAHEAFHVWQRSHGHFLSVTADGLSLGIGGSLLGIDPYAYAASSAPHEMFLRFLMAGVEQQAHMFEDYVLQDLVKSPGGMAPFAEIARFVVSR